MGWPGPDPGGKALSPGSVGATPSHCYLALQGPAHPHFLAGFSGQWGRSGAHSPWVLSSNVSVWPSSSLSLRGNDPFTTVTLWGLGWK